MYVCLSDLIKGLSCLTIIGMEKNVGKTTLLNKLLTTTRSCSQAITSIGYDGEDTDQVTRTEKPSIYISSGILIATASSLLRKCDFTRELLALTGIYTPMGEVIILRALSDGYVQLAGPSTTFQMKKVVDLLKKYGAKQILIDGAAARKSTAAISSSDGCFLATGASFSHNIDKIIEETVHFVRLLTLPVYNSDSNNEAIFKIEEQDNDKKTISNSENVFYILDDNLQLISTGDALDEESAGLIAKSMKEYNNINFQIFFNGAVTQRFINRFLAITRNLKGINLIADDGTRFLISSSQLEQLQYRGAKLLVRYPVNLLGISVNPKSTDGTILDSHSLCKKLYELTSLPVFDTMALPC